MQKIQVFLRQDQKTALKSLSRRLGLRQSDLVRRGVDLLIDKAGLEQSDWREVTRATAGLWRDRTDIDELMQGSRQQTKARFGHVYDGE